MGEAGAVKNQLPVVIYSDWWYPDRQDNSEWRRRANNETMWIQFEFFTIGYSRQLVGVRGVIKYLWASSSIVNSAHSRVELTWYMFLMYFHKCVKFVCEKNDWTVDNRTCHKTTFYRFSHSAHKLIRGGPYRNFKVTEVFSRHSNVL